MADTSLVFDILGRDRVGPVLAKVKAEAAAANDSQVKGLSAVENALKKAEAETEALGKAFRKTGDVDVYKAFKDSEKAVNGLKKIKGELENVGSDAEQALGGIGQTITNVVDSGITSASKWASENPYVAAGIAAGVLLGTPLIGAAITAAVGGGFLAGGILLAAQDSRVKTAWSSVFSGAKADLTDAASVFIGPLTAAASKFGTVMSGIMPHIRGDFAAVAPLVDGLVHGIGGLLSQMMPGIDKMVRAAGPLIQMIADKLPDIGHAISTAFSMISAGSQGGTEALHVLIDTIDGAIIATGALIFVFEKWFLIMEGTALLAAGQFSSAMKAFKAVADNGAGSMDHLATSAATADASLGKAGSAAQLSSNQFTALSGQISATAQTMDVLKGQMVDKVVNTLLNGDEAVLGFDKSLTSLSDTLRQNKNALDIHAAAGQADRQAILDVIAANLKAYDTNIASGISAEDAASAYNTNTAALERQMRQAGLTQGQINGLIGKYRNVPSEVDTNVAMRGIQAVLVDLDNVIRRLNHLPDYVPVTIDMRVLGQSRVDKVQNTLARLGGGRMAKGGVVAAASGTITSSPMVLFGERETGQEAYIPKKGISDERGLALAAAAAGWHGGMVVPKGAGRAGDGASGGGAVTVSFDVTGADQEFLKLVRKMVRINGGGNVQTALGRN